MACKGCVLTAALVWLLDTQCEGLLLEGTAAIPTPSSRVSSELTGIDSCGQAVWPCRPGYRIDVVAISDVNTASGLRSH